MRTAEVSRQPRPETTVQVVILGGLVIGGIGLWAALAKLAHPSPVLVVRYVVVGLVYLGAGWLLAQRGYGTLGLLFALTGALWFVPEVQDSRREVLVGVAVLLSDVYRVTFAHAMLAYPDGRIRPRVGVWAVAAGYVLTLVGGAARALTYQPYRWESCDCPHNGFAVFHNQSTYDHVNDPYRIVALILAVAAIVLIAVKARSVIHRVSASSVPMWTAFVASVALVAANIVRDEVDLSAGAFKLWLWVDGVALIAVAVAFVLTLRGRSPAREAPAAVVSAPGQR
jgi:hypothetical protein